jgi:hypothetical protein
VKGGVLRDVAGEERDAGRDRIERPGEAEDRDVVRGQCVESRRSIIRVRDVLAV